MDAATAVFLIGIGVALAVYAVWSILQGTASRDWPRTQATIVRSRIDEQSDEGTTTYVPIIEYEYSVSGQTFRSNRIRFGGVSGSRKRRDIAAIVNTYPLDKRVEVRYDPQDLTTAVLETGTDRRIVVVIALAALFLSLGIISLISHQRL